MVSIMVNRIKIVCAFSLIICLTACKKDKVKTRTSYDIYNSYSVNHKGNFFFVPPSIVSIFLDESQKGNTELKDLLIDVKELSFLIINKNDSESKESTYLNELNTRLDSLNFYDLAQINNGKELIRVKVDGKSKHFNELVVLVSNSNAIYCISFKGKIHSKKVLNLVKPENVKAVTNLDRFKQ
jgi:hypothetical protein